MNDLINKGINEAIVFFSKYEYTKNAMPSIEEIKTKFKDIHTILSDEQQSNNRSLQYDKDGLQQELIGYLKSIKDGRRFSENLLLNSLGSKEIFKKLVFDYTELSIWYEFHLLEFKRINEPKQNESVFTFENKFDSVPENKVIEYYKTELVDKKYLTENELYDFIKHAFDLKEKPNTRFCLSNIKNKGDIHNVFYCYYKDIAGCPPSRQKEYVALLGDYFVGYNVDTLITNWSKKHTRKTTKKQ